MNQQIQNLQNIFHMLFGGASNAVNNVSQNITGHRLTGGQQPQRTTLPASSTLLMDSKAQPLGSSRPQINAYNARVGNYNQNAQVHLNPLTVAPALQWQQGQLRVQPLNQAQGYYVNPFDTDRQTVNPFQFGSRNNYMGTGVQVNPQLPRFK